MIEKISHFIAYHPKIILTVATLLLIPCFFGYINMQINYDIMSYLPEDLDSVKGEVILDEVFGNSANAFLVIEDMPSKDVAAVKEKVAAVNGVKSVTWTDTFADISIPQSMLPDVVKNIFYSTDGNATMMMVQFENGSSSEITMQAIKDIKSLMNKQCFLSGVSAIMADTRDLVETEAPIYIAIAVALALIALSFTMESWILPFVLLLALGYAVIYNMGTNLTGSISYITQSIAAILQLGVTMDYSVFLMDRYDEELLKASDRKEAMSRAIFKTFVSLVGSSMTTVFGFLALCFMSFTLGLDIGIVMSKGVILGVLSVVIVLPSMLLMFHTPIHRFRHKPLVPKFDGLAAFSVKHRKVIAAVFLILIVPSIVMKNNANIYYDFEKALPQDMSSVASLSKLKTDFNMATTHFVIIDEDIPSRDVSKMVNEFEQVDGISTVLSLNSFVGSAIPEDIIPDSVKEICQKGGYRLMMINSVYGPATDSGNAQIDTLLDILHKYDENGYITGEGALAKDLVTVTDRDFKITSIISIAAIFVLIAICFKSISIPVILVASIELAILINEAISFITGAEVPFIAPTVIGCVQLGATVDYAILMTTRYREELRSGKDKTQAVKDAATASCRSIFQSALVFFCATFGVYLVCNVMLVKSICAMLARGAVISALIIMICLPAILCICEKLIEKTTFNWKKGDKIREN
ncbi:MAG: MMPL family transporter [Oscillospiraceae bacterium]|nr:MMPL family transporter [Oscillospiraceae bacterium]